MPEKKSNAISNINADHEENEKDKENTDSFSSKYRVMAKIGEGSYSEVLKCRQRETGVLYACKRLKHSYRGWKRVNDISEVATLKGLPRHPNILQMIEIHYDPSPGRVSLIFELMEMNLYELIKDRKRNVIGSSLLSEARVRVFMFQLVRALRHLHKNGIFHRDVKPENILLDTKTDILKLGDLGSVRGLYSKPPYTEYISTRWYRSPECLLTSGFYSYKMDVWAAGCVFYEIMTLRPLFPGASEIDQISRIHQILGPPPPKMLQKLTEHSEMSKKAVHRSAKPGRKDSITKVLNQLQCSEKNSAKGSGLISTNNSRKYFVNIEKLLPNHVNRDAIDLLRNMLQYDPDNRPTSHVALQHPYFDELRQTAKKFVNKVSYQHPLMTILGPEFVNEVNEEEIQRKQMKKDATDKYQQISSDDEDYVKDKSRHKRKARKKTKVEYAARRRSPSFSDTTLSSDSSETFSKESRHRERKSKSPHEKSSNIVKEIKVMNGNSYTEIKTENMANENVKGKPAKKAKHENSMATISSAAASMKRPPLPPSVTDVGNSQGSNAKVSLIRTNKDPRHPFKSLSQISLIDQFPKASKSKNEALTKSDLQKINEGRRLVQMLPIGKSGIRKSILSSDISPINKASPSSSREMQRLKANFESEPKISRIPNLITTGSGTSKSPFTKTYETTPTVGHIPSFADRLKTLYPMPKLLDTMNINRREPPLTRKQLLESKARALGIVNYKVPGTLSDLKYGEERVIASTNHDFRTRKRPPIPGASQMPPLSPVDIERHRSYMRPRRESVNIEKYKNEISPYSKFFVVDDLNEDEKIVRTKKNKDAMANVGDTKSSDGTNNSGRNVSAALKRVEAIAGAAKLPLNASVLERHRVFLQRQRVDAKFKNEIGPYTKFYVSSDMNDDGSTKDSSLSSRNSVVNLKGTDKQSLKLDSNSNYSGYNRGIRKQVPLESMEMERNHWYLPRRTTGNRVSEKYKSEMDTFAKLYTVDDHSEDIKRHPKKDATGAASIVFPRNRFGENAENNYKPPRNQMKDYNSKYPNKNSMNYHSPTSFRTTKPKL